MILRMRVWAEIDCIMCRARLGAVRECRAPKSPLAQFSRGRCIIWSAYSISPLAQSWSRYYWECLIDTNGFPLTKTAQHGLWFARARFTITAINSVIRGKVLSWPIKIRLLCLFSLAGGCRSSTTEGQIRPSAAPQLGQTSETGEHSVCSRPYCCCCVFVGAGRAS